MNEQQEVTTGLAQRRVLLGVGGGIAAYKAADLVRRLREAGAEVRVVMTDAAQAFVTPLTFQAVSGQPVRGRLLDETAEAGMGHIELARWAQTVLIAPATADLIARLAAGLADDLLTTLCLATEAEVVLAPAMNRVMWAHPATRANLATLHARGVRSIGPAAGDQACGETGAGRMSEPLEIVGELAQALAAETLLRGRKVVVTAGPTLEDLDPVRFIGNRSSGRMGFALAAAFAEAGAQTVLVAGPVQLPTPPGIERIDVRSACQMRDAVLQSIGECDIFVAAAAVADFRPATVSASKIKKEAAQQMQVDLVRNPDILAEVAALADGPYTVGFAAETDQLVEHARAKLESKGLDLIAANQVGGELGFDSADNRLTVLWNGGSVRLDRAPKPVLARQLVRLVARRLETSDR